MVCDIDIFVFIYMFKIVGLKYVIVEVFGVGFWILLIVCEYCRVGYVDFIGYIWCIGVVVFGLDFDLYVGFWIFVSVVLMIVCCVVISGWKYCDCVGDFF